MDVKDIKTSEVSRVIDMWKESYYYNCGYTIYTFCEELLTRCECCGEIHYKEDCEMVRMWDEHVLICCPECKKEVNSDEVSESEEMGVL